MLITQIMDTILEEEEGKPFYLSSWSTIAGSIKKKGKHNEEEEEIIIPLGEDIRKSNKARRRSLPENAFFKSIDAASHGMSSLLKIIIIKLFCY